MLTCKLCLLFVLWWAGYIDLQFRGIIRNLKVNGQRVPLKEKSGSGEFKVVRCNSKAYRNFTNAMDAERNEHVRPWQEEADWNYNSYDNNYKDSESSFFDQPDPQESQNYPAIGGVY